MTNNVVNLHAFIDSECDGAEFKHEVRWIEEFVVSKKIPTTSGQKIEKNSDDADIQRAFEIIQRRKQGEPLAYIFGSWAFREFEFFCGPGVLIPRPETEELVDLVVGQVDCQMTSSGALRVVDFGAGTGCLGISTAVELQKKFPKLKISLTLVEKSPDAFSYLKKNVEKYLGRNSSIVVSTLNQDWTEYVKRGERFDVLVSNPPYLSESEFQTIDESVKNFEPKAALVPENDSSGMLSYLELLKIGSDAGAKLMAFELGTFQAPLLFERVRDEYKNFSGTIEKDMSGKSRFLISTRR